MPFLKTTLKRASHVILGPFGYEVRRTCIELPFLQTMFKRASDVILGPFGYEVTRKGSVCWEPIGFDGLIPPRDQWGGASTDALSWYFSYFWEYRAYLTLLCGLRTDHSVLELGCSFGRTMLALLGYLEPLGRYEGLDIRLEHIKFAQDNIHARYPHFNFTAADVYNKVFNPHGREAGDSYKFPYADGRFDIVYAASLFTHLLPADSANYFKESRRVLRTGGRCLFSFFALDYYRGPGTSTSKYYNFTHPLARFDGVGIYDPQLPEQAIAYEIGVIKKMASEAGLKVERIVSGFWSNAHKVAVNEQDLVLLVAV